MNQLLRLFALLSPATLCIAQVGVSVDAVSPMVATCAGPGFSVTDSRPAGPLPLSDALLASAPNNISATISHACVATATGVSCSFTVTGHVPLGSPSGAMATAGPADYLVTLQSVTPSSVSLSVVFEDFTTPGSRQPLAAVDVGNDGIYDFFNGAQAVPLPHLVIGPQPLLLRVHTEGFALDGESFSSLLTIHVAPTNGLSMTTAAIGCAGQQSSLTLRSSFLDQGFELTASANNPVVPVVAVFGFGVQPVLLPSFGTLPCLLVPRPDVTLLMMNSTVSVGLPPSLRPLTFWVQGVSLASRLLATDCTRVDAL
jgi:hypothetical protein